MLPKASSDVEPKKARNDEDHDDHADDVEDVHCLAPDSGARSADFDRRRKTRSMVRMSGENVIASAAMSAHR
jgi:hypothetical protein